MPPPSHHPISRSQADMVHEMGHGGDMSMAGMVEDMKRRFFVALAFAIPVFVYSPLFTQIFRIQAPLPFGVSISLL